MKQSYLEDSTIETGLIVDVDVKNWTVDVGTQHSDKQLFGIPWSAPYLHPETGEGIHYFPEIGAQCLVCTPSDGELSPFVLGYLPIPKKESFRSNRIDMNPGDIAITTRDGNFVIARRGGVVQIGATKLAQRLYLPVGNIITDFAQSYGLHTAAGDWIWDVDLNAKDAEGTPGRWVLKARQHAEDTAYAVVMTIGKTLPKDNPNKTKGESNLGVLEGGSSPLLELDIKLPNKVGFNVAIDGSGNVFAKSGGSMGWDVEKDLLFRAGRNYTAEIAGTAKTTATEIIQEATKHKATWQISEETFVQKFLKGRVSMGNTDGGVQGTIQGDALLTLLSTPGVFKVSTPKETLLCTPGPAFPALRAAVSESVKVGK